MRVPGGGGGGAGTRRLGSESFRGAPVSGGPRHVVRGSGGRRRGGRDDRQLPARAVALLRQSARFLSAAGLQGPNPLLSRVLFHRTRRGGFGVAARTAARPAALRRIVPGDEVLQRGR